VPLYYAILSGLHPTLPEAELRGILESEGFVYRIVESLDQAVVFECNCSSSSWIAERAGLVHETGRLISIADAEPEAVAEELRLNPPCRLLSGRSARIVFVRLRGYAKAVVPSDLAVQIARRIHAYMERQGCSLSPRGPETILVAVTQGAALIGVREGVKPRKLLASHRPSRRPFTHPGGLEPSIARVFVNLSRASPRRGKYLDPFCGTGGFALEAQTIGVETVCGELSTGKAKGAKTNLHHYPGAANTTIVAWDATKLPLRPETIASIGTDPPYGRSISLHGKTLENLLENFLNEAARILRPGGYLAYATPHWAEREAIEKTRQAGLQLLEKHYMRVHGSLTRIIIVSRKPLGPNPYTQHPASMEKPQGRRQR